MGGRPEPHDDQPEDTIRRELWEEAGVVVTVGSLIDIWFYDVARDHRVAIASYTAWAEDSAALVRSEEHGHLAFFDIGRLDEINLPQGYKTSIHCAQDLLAH